LKPHPSAAGRTKLLRFGLLENGMAWTAIAEHPKARTIKPDEKSLSIHCLPAMLTVGSEILTQVTIVRKTISQR
jgi:hypothetical protein